MVNDSISLKGLKANSLIIILHSDSKLLIHSLQDVAICDRKDKYPL